MIDTIEGTIISLLGCLYNETLSDELLFSDFDISDLLKKYPIKNNKDYDNWFTNLCEVLFSSNNGVDIITGNINEKNVRMLLDSEHLDKWWVLGDGDILLSIRNNAFHVQRGNKKVWISLFNPDEEYDTYKDIR